MKKVLMGHDEQMNTNTSNLSRLNSNMIETNEIIIMDIDNSNNIQYPILDDDDSRSADFISDSNQLYPDDDASLNSSQSSLRHTSSIPHNNLLIDRPISTTSQSISNQMTSNIINFNPRFASVETNNSNQSFLLDSFPPLEINIDESNISVRNDVSFDERFKEIILFFFFFFCNRTRFIAKVEIIEKRLFE